MNNTVVLSIMGILAIIVFLLRGKLDDAEAKDIQSDTHIKDASLVVKQTEDEQKIADIDKQITQIKEPQVPALTDEERAKTWNKQ